MGMNTDAVQRLYVAYFNRPADPVSMSVYESLLPTDRAATQAELQALAEQYFSPSAEYTSLYAGMSNTQIVNQLYQNIFGRVAEVDGLVYWAAELTAGRQTVASIALQLSYSAQGTDAAVVTNRIEAANSFTTGLNTAEEITGYSGDAAAASARAWLATVGSDTASKDAAVAGVDTAVSDAVTAGGTDAAKTLTLTTGIDKFTGGSGNDIFNADNTGASEVTSTADTLDGSTGDSDTLNIFSDGTIAAAPSTSNIEILNLYDEDTDFTATSTYAGVSTMNFIRGDGTIDFAVSNTVTTVGLQDMVIAGAGGTDGVGVTYGAATTSATLNLTAVSTAGADADEDITVAGTKLTSLTVNVLSTSSTDNFTAGSVTSLTIDATGDFTPGVLSTGAGAASTLTLKGAGKITVGVLDNDFTTVDGTGSSGGLVVTAATDSKDAVITLGTGADTFTTDDDGFATTDKFAVNAGDGEDTLVVAAAADVDTADEAGRYTNFDVISNGTGDDLDMSLFSGIDKGTVTATNGGFLKMSAAMAGDITVTANNDTFVMSLATSTGTSDKLSVTSTNTTATTSSDFTTATITGFEILEFAANSGDANLGTAATVATTDRTAVSFAAAADLTTVTLTGTKSVNLNLANAVKVATVDASGVAGGALITLAANTVALTVTGSAVRDNVALATVGTGGSQTINAGDGGDYITGTIAQATAAVINGEAGTDTLSVSDVSAADATLTIGDSMFNDMNVEVVDFSGTILGDLVWTVGGFADSMATRNGNNLKITGDTFTTTSAADDLTIDASAMSAGNSISVDIKNTAVTNTKVSDVSVTGSGGNDTIKVEEAKAAGATQFALTGGAGDDTITVVTTATQDGKIVVTSGSGNDTIVLTNATTDAAAADNLITPGTGDDTIKLDSEGAATDFTIVAGATAAANGTDTISAFKLGAGGDVWKPDAFLNATAMNAALTANPGAGSDVENDVNLLVDIAGGQDITTKAGLEAALASGGEYENVNMAASKTAVFVTAADANAGTTQNVFYASSDAGGNITVTLVAQFADTAVDINDWVAANFAI